MEKKEKWDRNEITGKQFGFFMNMDSAASFYAMDIKHNTKINCVQYHSIASVAHIANTVRYDVCQRHIS